jgi:long-chain acyl-CoA synthetase
MPAGIATYHRDASGQWVATTWSALWAEVRHTAEAFRRLGLQPRERVAIVARTCREWQIAELGALVAGAAVVGIDAHAAGEQIAWILAHADVSALVTDTAANASKATAGGKGDLKFVVAFDAKPAIGSTSGYAWAEALVATPRPSSAYSPLDPDQAAMLIYTSGTTGTPKGIEYSHRQLMASCWATVDEFPDLGERNRLICWLPMAPLFQRLLNLVAFASQSVTYFLEDPREIMACVADVRPTAFASVPRFYEKLHAGIQERLSAQSGFRKRLVGAGLAAGAEWAGHVRQRTAPSWGLRLRHAVLDRLVLRKIRGVMGGELKWMITGSAPAPVWLLEFFHSVGLLVLEAYGVTENPVPIAANRSNAYRFGSVGRPFRLNEVRIAEDSEVLVKGPALFDAYRKDGRPADRFTADGYYRTGDYGRLDADGFLYLTGRVAEMIKTTTGRRISPAAVEAVYRRSPYIDQIVVVGNDRPYLVALVSLNASAVRERVGLTASDGELAAAAVVSDLIASELARLGNHLAQHEQVRAWHILSAPLTMESGDLTSNLKLRRTGIEARHRAIIDHLYTSPKARRTAPESAAVSSLHAVSVAASVR